MLYKNILEMVGNTPILELNKYKETNKIEATIYAKLEKNNPTGSVKDRAAANMIKKAIESGELKKGGTIIEPTSGNTGIALAAYGNYFDINVIIVMPSSMSEERKKMIKDFGAELVLIEGGMKDSITKAEELSKEIEGSIILGQFDNDANPDAHYNSTIREILNDVPDLDILVVGTGTGGTLTGSAKYIREKNLDIKIVAVEPTGSPFLTKGLVGKHKVQGIGPGFIPKNLNVDYIDEVVMVNDKDAIERANEIVLKEGVFVGISSGAALQAATEIAKRSENKGKNVLAIFPDTGERYVWR